MVEDPSMYKYQSYPILRMKLLMILPNEQRHNTNPLHILYFHWMLEEKKSDFLIHDLFSFLNHLLSNHEYPLFLIYLIHQSSTPKLKNKNNYEAILKNFIFVSFSFTKKIFFLPFSS